MHKNCVFYGLNGQSVFGLYTHHTKPAAIGQKEETLGIQNKTEGTVADA